LKQFGIFGDRGIDQGGSGLPPLPGQLSWHLIGADGLDQPVQRQRVLQQRHQHWRHLLAGHRAKTVLTEARPVEISVLRDRDS
jgi:hypothetical protein